MELFLNTEGSNND